MNTTKPISALQLWLCFLRNYKRSKTKLQDSFLNLVNKIMFHTFSKLFADFLSKHVSSASCQHSVTSFSLIQPLLVCLTFFMSTLHQDIRSSSDSRILRVPHIKTQTFGHCSLSYAAPSVWNSLPRQNYTFSQPLFLKLPWRLICSNPTSAS